MSLARWNSLTAKVDGFFDRVAARHGDAMDCASGCADCCHTELTVTAVEAAAVTEAVATLPTAIRASLLAATTISTGRCVALNDADRCSIYAGRPLVCRSHGAPIRLRDARSLPVVQCCPRNFTDSGPASADPDCILDQTTLSTLLLAVDQDYTGGAPVPRVALRDLIASLTADTATTA